MREFIVYAEDRGTLGLFIGMVLGAIIGYVMHAGKIEDERLRRMLRLRRDIIALYYGTKEGQEDSRE